MKKKLALLLMCVIMCCAIVATTLVACTDDTWTFKVEGVIGYSDAIVDEANKTVSFAVQSSINSFDLNNIKVPATLSYTVKNAAKEAVTGNTILLNPGDNTYYMTFKGEVEVSGKKYPVDVEWTIKIKRLTSELTISNVEIATFETAYTVGEAFKGGKIKLTYADDSTVLVDIYPVMVTGFDTSKPGSYNVTIKYDEYTFERTINVISEDIGELEDVTPTVITKIDSALDTFARFAAYMASGETEGNTFNSYKNDFLATLNDNKAEMKSFLEYLGVTDANIAGMSTIADKVAPIVKKIATVANNGGENYEQLYTQEFIAEIQGVAKDILGMFSSSQLTLASEKILNWSLGQQLIDKEDYIEYTTPITDATIKAKVIAQFEMWTDGDYRDMPLNKNDIFVYISNADNILNYIANIDSKKVSTIISTLVKIFTVDDLTPDNILNIGAVNLKNTINYIGEIISGVDNSLVDTRSMIACINKIFRFVGDSGNNIQVFDIIFKSDILDTKLVKIVGEVLTNLSSDNVLEIVDLAKDFINENNIDYDAAYGNVLHYAGRLIVPVIDKYYPSEQFNSQINEFCSIFADIFNSIEGYESADKNEISKAISGSYKLIYDASKKETLTKTEQAELYKGVIKFLSEINIESNPIRVTNYYETLLLPTNMTESDFYEYLNMRHSIYCSDSEFGQIELEFSTDICKGIDLTKAGSQTMTIKVDKYVTTMKFYFVDDSNKDEFNIAPGGILYNYVSVRFALNSDPNDHHASIWSMRLINRNDNVNYTIDLNWNTAKYIGVDTKTTGQKKAIVEYTDRLFGTVYFPIDYIVYDPENPKVEREYIYIDSFYLGISAKLTGRMHITYDSEDGEEKDLPDNIFSHLKKDAVGRYTDTVTYKDKSYKVSYYVRDAAWYFRDNMYYDYNSIVAVGANQGDVIFRIAGNTATLAEINAWLAERNLGSIYIEDFDSSAPGYHYSELYFKYTDGKTMRLNSFDYDVDFDYEIDIDYFQRQNEYADDGSSKYYESNILTDTDIDNLTKGNYDGFDITIKVENSNGNFYNETYSLSDLMAMITEKYGNAHIKIKDGTLFLYGGNKIVGGKNYRYITDKDAATPREYRLNSQYYTVQQGGMLEKVYFTVYLGSEDIEYAVYNYNYPITPEQITGIDFNQIGTQDGIVTINGIDYNISIRVYY